MIRVGPEPIRIEDLVQAVRGDGDGAIALFVGTVRDRHFRRRVVFLEYVAYVAMAERVLRAIADEAVERHGVSKVAIAHRTGRVDVGEASVVVAVASPHRAQALEACRVTIDALKNRAPIWKKEHGEAGAAWIEGAGETPGAEG